VINIKQETIDKYNKILEIYLCGEQSLIKLCSKFKVSRGKITKYFKEMNIPIVNKQNEARMDESIFEIIDTEEKAYWFGFMCADGYNSIDNCIEFKLSIIDYDHLDKFCKFIKYTGNIKTGVASDKAFCRVSFRNKKISKDLRNLGCLSPKSLSLKFPTYKEVPKDLMRHFIRGYIDGDGYISLSDSNKPRF